MSKLNKLYKQTSSDAIQEWQVSVEKNTVITRFGQLNSPNIQETSELVYGKNIGKINETTDGQQASLRAQQMYDAKIKKGYTKDLDLAMSTKNTLDAVNPMLAYPIEKKEKYAIFPALVQPKLDGLRIISIVKNGKCTLYSRTQKIINTLPHINREIEIACKLHNIDEIILDGEAYNHDLKNDFNRLVSLIKRDEPHEDCTIVQYHIYDVVSDENYNDRSDDISIFTHLSDHLFFVLTLKVNSREDLEEIFHLFLEKGYEGVMYRNPNIGYEQKRSTSLLKVKVMEDAEFEIIGVNEGKGKLAGKAGAFVCLTPEGKTFKAKLKGSIDNLTEYLVNFDKYKGKQLTVQFQGLTTDKIPRFPVGLRLRGKE